MRKIFAVILAISLAAISLYFFAFESKTSTKIEKIDKVTESLILPDLQTSEPEELYIEFLENSKKIRFSTGTLNSGEGDLKILGESDPQKKITKATQIIRTKEGGEFRKEIGEFVFHPEHDHWHVEKFTQFQLWNIKDNGDLDKLVATTDKMSSCIWDEERIEGLVISPIEQQFRRDCENIIQGISAGWSDTYPAYLPGQELDITSVKDGKYAIKSIINPENKILESNYNNNSVVSYIEIGNGVNKIENIR